MVPRAWYELWNRALYQNSKPSSTTLPDNLGPVAVLQKASVSPWVIWWRGRLAHPQGPPDPSILHIHGKGELEVILFVFHLFIFACWWSNPGLWACSQELFHLDTAPAARRRVGGRQKHLFGPCHLLWGSSIRGICIQTYLLSLILSQGPNSALAQKCSLLVVAGFFFFFFFKMDGCLPKWKQTTLY
jgi:hypothetical protein